MQLTNEKDIGLSMAVFLAHDEYDYDPRPNQVSTTGLLKSVRQIILSKRAAKSLTTMDISTLAASSFGTAVHSAVENAWSNGNHIRAMKKLGYSDKVIKRVVINPGYKMDEHSGRLIKDPSAPPLPKNAVPVFMEIRSEKVIDGVIVSGKFDFVGDGELEDVKTTGVYGYMSHTNDEDYRIQGSVYRWLNQDIITSDRLLINYVFTDWSKLRSMIEAKKGYPQFKMQTVAFTLMSLEDTEQWLRSKIGILKANLNKDEADLPLCTKEELWQGDTVYKYYKNPQSKAKATRNFDTFAEAQQRHMKDGSVGEIVIVPGKAKKCGYCQAFDICSQAKQLLADGLLDV